MKMVVVTMPKRDDTGIISEVKTFFPESDELEIESFGMDAMIQFLIPALAILSPAATAIVTQILQSKNITIKYNGIELIGNYKAVTNKLEELLALDKKEEDKKVQIK